MESECLCGWMSIPWPIRLAVAIVAVGFLVACLLWLINAFFSLFD